MGIEPRRNNDVNRECATGSVRALASAINKSMGFTLLDFLLVG
jgi:hypothetical protein